MNTLLLSEFCKFQLHVDSNCRYASLSYILYDGLQSKIFHVEWNIMFESEKPKNNKKETEGAEMTRRGFLWGGTALVASSAIGYVASKTEQQELIDENMVHVEEGVKSEQESEIELLTDTSNESVEYTHSDSEFFNADVEAYSVLYTNELPYVLEKASRITNNDEKQRTLSRYIQEELQLPSMSEILASELKKMFVGLAVVESGYDETVVSEDGARGILQILPNVWAEHAKEGMHPLALRDQVYVAGKYMEQMNRHFENTCAEALEGIKNSFFGGDTNAFELGFKGPALVGGYFAGMGTTVDLINWFYQTYKKPEDTIEELNQSEILTGYDVYYMFTRTAFHQAIKMRFKEKAIVYVLKVFGARLMLDRELDDEQKKLLLS